MAVYVGDSRIGLDMKDNDANVHFVSHAHSDHTGGVRKTSSILCSGITKDLIETRIKYEVKVAEKPSGVEMLDSGHMLGSKQLYVEQDSGASLVYTGDYQMQKSPVAEKIEIRHADILIMDSTYPFPNVVFDSKEEVIANMQSYIKKKGEIGSILFGAYSMGKAQELIRICNEIGIAPLVDPNIEKMNKVYLKHGIPLDYHTKDFASGIGGEEFAYQVWIVSMHLMDNVRRAVSATGRQVFTAVATGFARMRRFNTDVQFALSDHADFVQAVEYIDRCNPKFIYTCGSGCDTFAKNLKANGYNANPINRDSNISRLLVNYV
ncbi:MAG: MBL fold metallo-hydrolase [Candidatus Micrarchaeaceae archaeon]